MNSVLDAAYKSVKSKLWEPIVIEDWRGQVGLTKPSTLVEFDADHYLVKEEVTHYGAKKLILKEKKTGNIIERILSPFFFDLPRGKLIINEKKAQVALGILA